ncbi:hypothetical protein HPP92_026981 [Vanilla planifolia]|uniref:Uncharacterized protein n=1 Tax=Vanilla planifolia TaxID=51239 RepID=A0A835U8G7_VANPL|nr:hypothetical protein HPP92_026981 [Vanilla planifolia]
MNTAVIVGGGRIAVAHISSVEMVTVRTARQRSARFAAVGISEGFDGAADDGDVQSVLRLARGGVRFNEDG